MCIRSVRVCDRAVRWLLVFEDYVWPHTPFPKTKQFAENQGKSNKVAKVRFGVDPLTDGYEMVDSAECRWYSVG